jgi:hypothetical protein
MLRRSRTGKKAAIAVAVAAAGRYPVKAIADALKVSRSNLIERLANARAERGPCKKAAGAVMPLILQIIR